MLVSEEMPKSDGKRSLNTAWQFPVLVLLYGLNLNWPTFSCSLRSTTLRISACSYRMYWFKRPYQFSSHHDLRYFIIRRIFLSQHLSLCCWISIHQTWADFLLKTQVVPIGLKSFDSFLHFQYLKSCFNLFILIFPLIVLVTQNK